MKMAKASTADIEMALELSRFVEDLVDGMCPKQACADPESDDIEWLEDDPDEQHLKIISALQGIARKGSIFRVTFGMSVLVDQRNELIDPASDTLDPHPKIERLADQVEALTKEREALRAELARPESTAVSLMRAENAALKDAARLALDALEYASTGNRRPEGTIGMTLRDYFAAQVISQQLRYCETNESAARQAYKIADAMMEWRK